MEIPFMDPEKQYGDFYHYYCHLWNTTKLVTIWYEYKGNLPAEKSIWSAIWNLLGTTLISLGLFNSCLIKQSKSLCLLQCTSVPKETNRTLTTSLLIVCGWTKIVHIYQWRKLWTMQIRLCRSDWQIKSYQTHYCFAEILDAFLVCEKESC